jgi:predicted Zn-dependent peptidase
VQTDKTKEALAELRRQTRMIAGDEPISDAELRTAKAAFAQSYASGFETSSDLASMVENLWISNLPQSAMQTDPEEIARTSRNRIEEGIRSLNIGPIILLNADGSPVSPTDR